MALDACKIGFMRRMDCWKTQHPRYFFYFSDKRLFPEFADCLPADTLPGQDRMDKSCMARLLGNLSRNYQLVLKNTHVEVFDLIELQNEN